MESTMTQLNLTEQAEWDDYWSKVRLPMERKKTERTLYLNEILGIFDRYLPRDAGMRVLEIGGAPGQYLAYLHRNFGYEIHSLDYSEVGCRKTEENFKVLNIEGEVYRGDLFADDLSLGLFDIVYSLGFIEHFTDLEMVVGKHLDLLKPQGTLVLGVPNFLGINRLFLSRLAPKLLAEHNLEIMNVKNWAGFEKQFGLRAAFKGYVGGFEPAIFRRCEDKTRLNALLYRIADVLTRTFATRFKALRKLNTKYTSGYLMGVYHKP